MRRGTIGSIRAATCIFAVSFIFVLMLASCSSAHRSKGITSLPVRSPGSVSVNGENPQALRAVAVSTEEIWVIARAKEGASPKVADSPGSGTLMAKMEEKQIPMPLQHTSVKASINGYISTVEVVQKFQNPYEQKIEAVYVFPLPHNAAVNEFLMVIGERQIRGIVREREEAERI